jgi:hypothetical protein
MPPRQKVPLVPPLKGYSEVTAYAAQPEGTSPAVRNVMLNDPATERFRVAQRAGTGKYDLYDFNNGGPFDPPDITLPADGTGDDGGPTINLPGRDDDCYTIELDDDDSGLWDLLVSNESGCGPTTVQVNGDPNTTGTPVTGTITITPGVGGSGTTTIGVSQPGGGSSSPTGPGGSGGADDGEDEYRPWIAAYTCVGHTFAFWVHQSVLSNPTHPNRLVSLKDGTTCYKLTGRRATDSEATNRREWRSMTVYENCTDCAGDKKCYYVFKAYFNCAATPSPDWQRTGGDITKTYDHALCAVPSSIQAIETWFRVGQVGDLVEYNYYEEDTSCTALGDCTDPPENSSDPRWPPDPAFTPACDVTCGPCELYVGQSIIVTNPPAVSPNADWGVTAENTAAAALVNAFGDITFEVAAVDGSTATCDAVVLGQGVNGSDIVATLSITCGAGTISMTCTIDDGEFVGPGILLVLNATGTECDDIQGVWTSGYLSLAFDDSGDTTSSTPVSITVQE